MNTPKIPYDGFSINTKRLRIRPLIISDFQSWKRANEMQRPSQNQFDPGRRPDSTRNITAFKKIVSGRRMTWKNDRFYGMGIFEKKSNELVGIINLIPHARTIIQTSAIGYVIYNHHWRKGFATEAICAVVLFALKELKFHRLTAEIDVRNKSSIALSKKVGFRKEARANKLLFDDGLWRDCFIYSTTAEDWGVKKQKPFFRLSSFES